MKKDDLLMILSGLPEATPVCAVYSEGRYYSTRYVSIINGIKIYAQRTGGLAAALHVDEVDTMDDEEGKPYSVGTISKTEVETILKLIPENAEVTGSFSYKEYKTVYECYINHISLFRTEDNRLTMAIVLYRGKEEKAADLNQAA